ncbi:MAG: P27 family phage terminase small subunit [Candidatus Sulfotelmatobacter sp.]
MPTPRKSAAQHALEGTTPNISDKDAPAFVTSKLRMPKDLPIEAQVEWKRMAKDLHKRGTTTRVDSSAMEAYARTWALWRKMEAIAWAQPLVVTTWLDKHGEAHEKTVENPAIKSAANLLTKVLAYQREFSATPASREKTRALRMPAPKNPLPAPGSLAGLSMELTRLLAEREAQEAAAQSESEEPETEVDLDALLAKADEKEKP